MTLHVTLELQMSRKNHKRDVVAQDKETEIILNIFSLVKQQ